MNIIIMFCSNCNRLIGLEEKTGAQNCPNCKIEIVLIEE